MIAAASAEHRIVSHLVGGGNLTPIGLASMRRESEIGGLPLVEVLVSHGLITDIDVARVYADMDGLRFVDLTRNAPARAWVLMLPENIARRKDCLLYGEVGGQVLAAVADPVDTSVRAALEPALDRPVQFIVSPRRQIRETIEEIYGTARAGGARVGPRA